MAAPITRTLGRFSSELRYGMLPDLAVQAVLTAFTDSIAVMYYGMPFAAARQALRVIETRSSQGAARLYLGAERASVRDATFANAAALGACVYDDVAFAGCHTSVIMVPALLAEADATGASGQDVVAAYAAGYEIWARLSERDQDAYSSKGWHATAVFGAMAGAAAIANLRRLDAGQTTRALSIAAAMSGGITHSFDYDIGTIQMARAAAAGVLAADLAQNGLTASEDAIERPGRGILHALSPRGQVDLETPIEDLGRAWRLESVGIHVKQHPVGNMMQRAIDGMLDLVRAHDVHPPQVRRIEVLISLAQMEVHRKSPSTSGPHMVPSHSIGVALAAALIDRRVTFAHLTDAFAQRADAQAVMQCLEIVPSADVANDTTPNLGFSGGIRLHLADGRMLESPSVPFARGHWTRRLTGEEQWRKFEGGASAYLNPATVRALFDDLQRLHQLESTRMLNQGR